MNRFMGKDTFLFFKSLTKITMKLQIKLLAILITSILAFVACNENTALSPSGNETIPTSTSRVSAALLINNVFFATTGDSIVIPASAQAYIATNYPGYTITGGHKLNLRKDTTKVYEIDIVSSTDAKDIYFDANWNFVSDATKVKGDRNGKNGGKGDRSHRDSLSTGTAIDPTTIPASVTSFISTTYAGYTVIKGRNRTVNGVISNELLISNSTDMKVLFFDANWGFVSELLKSKGDEKGATTIDINTIPTNVSTYITTNYNGYSISSASSRSKNGIVSYGIIITNGTNIKKIIFDANWAFVAEHIKKR